jgi:hypothetical protein
MLSNSGWSTRLIFIMHNLMYHDQIPGSWCEFMALVRNVTSSKSSSKMILENCGMIVDG